MAFLFSPPTVTDGPRVPAGADRPTRGLFRHVVTAPRGVNVFIVAGEATENSPEDPTTADAVFLGGHVPYEVTEAQKTILEAAGYTVTET